MKKQVADLDTQYVSHCIRFKMHELNMLLTNSHAWRSGKPCKRMTHTHSRMAFSAEGKCGNGIREGDPGHQLYVQCLTLYHIKLLMESEGSTIVRFDYTVQRL